MAFRSLVGGRVGSIFNFSGFLKSKPQMELTRHLNCLGDIQEMSGLVLGLFTKDDDPYNSTKVFTKAAETYDKDHSGKLSIAVGQAGQLPRAGQTRIFYGLDPLYSAIVVVGIGDECLTYNELEQMDELKEAIRNAAALGAQTLQDLAMRIISIESFGNAESAAEGAAMGIWLYQEFRNVSNQLSVPKLDLFSDCDYTGWQIGLQKAAAQNLARQLCEMPGNLLTPITFAQAAVEVLCKAGMSVEVRVKEWVKLMNMNAFLAAAQGSCEPPIFLEVSYYGCDPEIAPIVLIGKGVTFDSGGLCLKDCTEQRHMRGDMAGAAAVVAASRAISALQLPVNLRVLIPLYENMPGTCALKPGDIVKARNGKTILVHDTDYDGRLSLADALCYANTYNPKFICDVGTLSKELKSAFGEVATGVFSNSDSLYETLKLASVHTGDRVWRLPLWQHFTEKVTTTPSSDVQDKLKETGLPCTCAAFLREFVTPGDWIHLDTYGVMLTNGVTHKYLREGMSGKPTRTLVEFIAQMTCKSATGKQKENTAAG